MERPMPAGLPRGAPEGAAARWSYGQPAGAAASSGGCPFAPLDAVRAKRLHIGEALTSGGRPPPLNLTAQRPPTTAVQTTRPVAAVTAREGGPRRQFDGRNTADSTVGQRVGARGAGLFGRATTRARLAADRLRAMAFGVYVRYPQTHASHAVSQVRMATSAPQHRGACGRPHQHRACG